MVEVPLSTTNTSFTKEKEKTEFEFTTLLESNLFYVDLILIDRHKIHPHAFS